MAEFSSEFSGAGRRGRIFGGKFSAMQLSVRDFGGGISAAGFGSGLSSVEFGGGLSPAVFRQQLTALATDISAPRRPIGMLQTLTCS